MYVRGFGDPLFGDLLRLFDLRPVSYDFDLFESSTSPPEEGLSPPVEIENKGLLSACFFLMCCKEQKKECGQSGE